MNSMLVHWPRYVSMLLGGWLFVSAFAWPHSEAACASAWIMGGTIAITALAATRAPGAHWFNVVAAVFTGLWTFTAASDEPLSRVNGLVVAAVVLVMAVVPSRVPLRDEAPSHSI